MYTCQPHWSGWSILQATLSYRYNNAATLSYSHSNTATVTAHPIVVTMTETACPMKSMIDPSEQTHAQSGSSTQNGAVAVTLLAGLSGTLATLTVTLSVW